MVSCADKGGLPPGIRGGGFKLPDGKHGQAIQALKRNDIAYAINERGFVIYMAEDISKVRKIVREVTYGSEIKEYHSFSEAFGSSERKDIFVEVLRDKGVWYDVSTFEGTINVHYLRQDIDKIDAAYQEAFLLYHERRIN